MALGVSSGFFCGGLLPSFVLALSCAALPLPCAVQTNYTPGWKFNDWELKGVPLRLEIGPRDVENRQTRVVRRDTSEARNVPWAEAGTTIPAMLETMQKDLFTKAKARFDASIEKISSFDEVMPALNRRHVVLAPWQATPTLFSRQYHTLLRGKGCS